VYTAVFLVLQMTLVSCIFMRVFVQQKNLFASVAIDVLVYKLLGMFVLPETLRRFCQEENIVLKCSLTVVAVFLCTLPFL